MLVRSCRKKYGVNIRNPEEFTILELAEEVGKIFIQRQIVFKERPTDDPTQRRPDISQAKKFLGWEPRVPLENGLQKMLEWIRSYQ